VGQPAFGNRAGRNPLSSPENEIAEMWLLGQPAKVIGLAADRYVKMRVHPALLMKTRRDKNCPTTQCQHFHPCEVSFSV
jgi:hypothetical protein